MKSICKKSPHFAHPFSNLPHSQLPPHTHYQPPPPHPPTSPTILPTAPHPVQYASNIRHRSLIVTPLVCVWEGGNRGQDTGPMGERVGSPIPPQRPMGEWMGSSPPPRLWTLARKHDIDSQEKGMWKSMVWKKHKEKMQMQWPMTWNQECMKLVLGNVSRIVRQDAGWKLHRDVKLQSISGTSTQLWCLLLSLLLFKAVMPTMLAPHIPSPTCLLSKVSHAPSPLHPSSFETLLVGGGWLHGGANFDQQVRWKWLPGGGGGGRLHARRRGGDWPPGGAGMGCACKLTLKQVLTAEILWYVENKNFIAHFMQKRNTHEKG